MVLERTRNGLRQARCPSSVAPRVCLPLTPGSRHSRRPTCRSAGTAAPSAGPPRPFPSPNLSSTCPRGPVSALLTNCHWPALINEFHY